MQPQTGMKLDQKEFDVLKRTIRNMAVSRRERKKNSEFATYLPESVGLKLTNRCNLRCKHCFQWNESGYHRFMDHDCQSLDMDIDLFNKILVETQEIKSRLYLWGGEPLYHSDFDRIAGLLENNPREMAMCTNATLLEEKMDAVCKISSQLELLIGVEGFEEENDEIRGKGTFSKAMKGIESLKRLRKQGLFKGKISVHTVVNDKMSGKLYSLMEYFEEMGIDMVMICFPWYISEECSENMDCFFSEKFEWLNKLDLNEKRSWNAFKYKLDPGNIGPLMKELEKINEKVWRNRIRYQPDLEFDEIEDFVMGRDISRSKTRKCLAISNRMDVDPDGTVSACKFFSEFKIGNIKDSSVYDLWNCESFKKVRSLVNAGLMPVCSKCSALYLHGLHEV
ncbi:radical SAM/SPASM domain-containing protein [Acetivibrio cellulolyticus]|uniref:radical SAM/SPASM domain-containing protein n=1 Tax=Acetivibrio cellulolyticus TaxID=35830 RepID=UPI0001E2E712|nr:radical SAM protein [Acetivibrio cellulolyticus]